MTEELMRIGISLPNDLLEDFDTVSVKYGYPSRSDAIRNAIRKYIQYYEWMNVVKGKRVGIFEMVYSPMKKGLSASIAEILSESNDIILLSMQIHLTNDNYLRIVIMHGEGQRLAEVAGKLMALRGVKQEKLTTPPRIE